MGWEYAGIKKITIPCKAEDLDVQTVERYLPDILAKHYKNQRKIKYLLNFADGSHQDIDNKQRLNGDFKNNNRILMNEAWAIVNFKQGFLLGDKRQYAPKDEGVNGAEIKALGRFDSDISFDSEDLEIKYNVYACGIGISFIAPRTDTIKDVGENAAVYKTLEDGYDAKNESPYVFQSLDPSSNGVVYTNRIGERGAGDLFDFNIHEEETRNGIKKNIVTVWTREWTADFEKSGKVIPDTLMPTPAKYKELPMVEHFLNKSRVGNVEIVLTLLNAINRIASRNLDNLEDVVDFILYFTNCELKKEDVEKLREQGVINIPSNGSSSVGVGKIDVAMDFSNVNIFFEQILTRCFDIVGVPLASASVGNGNNGAAYIGGGWTNAHTIIKRDIIAFEKGDRELLRKKLKICKLNRDNPIQTLAPSEIDIKYNPAMNDNLLEKTQAILNLHNAGMSFIDILKSTELFSDAETVAENWTKKVREDFKKEKKEEGQTNEVLKEDEVEEIQEKT